MRVLHLVKSLGRGGAETLLVSGLDAADRERLELSYAYFLPHKSQLVPDLRARGADVTLFSAGSSAGCLAQAGRVAALIRRERIDLVHTHLPIASVVGRIAGQMARVPVVSTEHNLLQRYHPATRLLTLSTWGLQSFVVAVSQEVADSIAAHAGTRVPVRVVRNGVDAGRFRRDVLAGRTVRAKHGIPEDSVVVGTVSVFRTQKRLDRWIEVAARVHSAHPNVRFLVVGEGPERPRIEDAIVAHRARDFVVLAGLQEEVRPYLSAMDVYLMTSVFEGLPVAMLEAMATECPVVATAVGGIPEVVRDGAEGFLASTEDFERVVDATSRLVAEPRLRVQLGAQARTRVVESFGMVPMQRELETVYEEVVQRVGAARR